MHRYESRWTDVDGPVHYLDFGGPAGAPLLVAVHGLGGSALNWAAIAPLLTDRFRVVAPDLAGHGRTQAFGRGTGVVANQGLLDRFLPHVADGPVLLAGNSMGGLISIHQAALHPDTVSGLVLVDPAVPLAPTRPDPLVVAHFAAYATPGVGTALLELRRRVRTPESAVAEMLALCCVDPGRVPADVVAAHVALNRERGAFKGVQRDFLTAARSVIATSARRGAYQQAMRDVRAPVLLVHGDRDRLVPLASARAAAKDNPSWSLVVLHGVGHAPQLEAAEDTAWAVLEWADEHGLGGGLAADGPGAGTGIGARTGSQAGPRTVTR